MKKYIYFLSLVSVLGCNNEDENSSENVTDETINEEIDSSNYVDESELYTTNELGSDIGGLIVKFENREILDSSDLEQMRLDVADFDEVSWPEPEAYFETELGHAFVYYTHGGCAATSCFGNVEIAYFDYDGYFINTVWAPVVDRDAEAFLIQDHTICIYDTYDEYIMGEYVEEATGNVMEVYAYFSEFDNKLQDVEDLSTEDMAIVRNTVFAKHGYTFTSEYYRNYFAQFGWYMAKHDNVDELLKEEEKLFADFMLELENE